MSETILIDDEQPTWRNNIRNPWFWIPTLIAALLLIGGLVFAALYMRANNAATEAGQTISSLQSSLDESQSTASTLATVAAENQGAAQNWQSQAETAQTSEAIAWSEVERVQADAQRAQETAEANLATANATAAALQADRDNAINDDRFVLPLDTEMVTELDTLATDQPISVVRYTFDTVYFVTADGQTLVGIITDNGRVFVDNTIVRRTPEELAAMNQIVQPKGIRADLEYTDEISLNDLDEPVSPVTIGTAGQDIMSTDFLEITKEPAPMDGYTMVRLLNYSGHPVNDQLFPIATWLLTGENVPANTAIAPTAAPAAVTSVPATGNQPAVRPTQRPAPVKWWYQGGVAAEKKNPATLPANSQPEFGVIKIRADGFDATGLKATAGGRTCEFQGNVCHINGLGDWEGTVYLTWPDGSKPPRGSEFPAKDNEVFGLFTG